MTQVLSPSARPFEEQSNAHRGLRLLLDQLGRTKTDDDRIEVAEALCLAVASHRATFTDSVLRRAVSRGPNQEQQARLLMVATHGIQVLVDRLRLPARDPRMVDNLVEALRTLVQEHERLELELELALASP